MFSVPVFSLLFVGLPFLREGPYVERICLLGQLVEYEIRQIALQSSEIVKKAPGKVIKKSPAKLNLSLKVLGRLPNGFHAIESVIVPISLHDILTVEVLPEGGSIEFECVFGAELERHIACHESNQRLDSALEIIRSDRNLVVAAAKTFFRSLGVSEDWGVRITLEKHVPFGAGLGGGSGNAASCLLALDELFDTQLGLDAMSKFAGELGSDVPCFLHWPRPVFAFGSGTTVVPIKEFEFVDDFTPKFLILKPPHSVDTAGAYRDLCITHEAPTCGEKEVNQNFLNELQLLRARGYLDWESLRRTNILTNSPQPSKSESPEGSAGIRSQLPVMNNDFEKVIREKYEAVDEIFKVLIGLGGNSCVLAGSGSSVAAVFRSGQDAHRVAAQLEERARHGGWFMQFAELGQ